MHTFSSRRHYGSISSHQLSLTSDPFPLFFYVQTDGINFNAAWTFSDCVDVNRIRTNHIAAMLDTYGIEAARASLMQEVSGVFGVYGIAVDPRHLSLITDFMTFQVFERERRGKQR